MRQLSIAAITFNWPRLTWPALCCATPVRGRGKISTTSRTGRPMTAGVYAGGISSDFSGVRRSSGLMTARMVLVATRV